MGRRERSRFIGDAARERLGHLRLEEALGSTEGILREAEHPEFRDQAAINEWVRAQRWT